MKILPIYVAKVLLGTIGLCCLVILGLDTFFGFVNELRYVGTGDYNLLQAATYLVFSLPLRLYTMFPLSALIGSLLGLGLLASHSELIAMRAAAVSVADIAGYVLKTATVLIVLVVIIGEVVAPVALRVGQQQKAFALSGGQAVQTAYGTWLRDGNSFIHIQRFRGNRHVEGITRYQFDDDLQLLTASYARSGEYHRESWNLFDVNESHFFPKKVTTQYYSSAVWHSVINPQVLEVVAVDKLEQLSVMDLWRTIHYRQANELETEHHWLTFWQKILHPFATLVMMLLAIPFVFGPLRSVTMGVRIVIGVLVGFSFHTLNALFGPMSLVYDLPPLMGAMLPTFMFALIGYALVKRLR